MPHPNPTTARATITALSRAGNIAAARQAFDSIGVHHQTPDTLNAMIAGYALDAHNPAGLLLFRRFQNHNLVPNEFTLSNVLSIAANLAALDQGQQVHAFVIKTNAAMDIAATNSLINLYFKCKSVGDAEEVFSAMPNRDAYTWTVMLTGYAMNGRMEKAVEMFDRMPDRNTVAWNSMISAYQRVGRDEMALELFSRMRRRGESPDKSTYVSVLKACSCLRLLGDGEGVHCCAVKSAWAENVLVRCTLMDMYAKCGDTIRAHKVFGEIAEHGVVSWSILLSGYAQNGKIEMAEGIFNQMTEKNVISWNTMIAGYVQNGKQERGFGLFLDMIKAGMRPNCFTFTSLMSGCSSPEYKKSGKSYHAYVLKIGLDLDTSIGNSMITMYGEQGDVGDARRVFDMIPKYDVVSWTAMVAAYISGNNLDEARCVFDRMPMKNLISWNTMMSGYLQSSNYQSSTRNPFHSMEDALNFFYYMEQSEIKPDHFSYNCSLTACANSGALEQARAIHCKTLKRGYESDLGVGNALITAYGKCGSLREAEKVFNSMANPDLISWNTLLTGYAQNGRGYEVLEFYKKMQNSAVEPNHVTFISLLSACSYMGEVEKGQQFFDSMEKNHGICPTKEHYACMVDLLGRAGLLRDAEAMFHNMTIEPDAALWGALLGASKIHRNHVIARRAAENIFRLEPDNSSAHIALIETYAASGMWEDVAKVWAVMKRKRILKEPGCSWIDVRNQKHMFVSGDSRHLEKDFIDATLDSLYSNMGMYKITDILDIGIT